MSDERERVADCPEGHTAGVRRLDDRGYYVKCDSPACWEGPVMDSRAEAVAAWGKVMAAIARAEAAERKLATYEGPLVDLSSALAQSEAEVARLRAQADHEGKWHGICCIHKVCHRCEERSDKIYHDSPRCVPPMAARPKGDDDGSR